MEMTKEELERNMLQAINTSICEYNIRKRELCRTVSNSNKKSKVPKSLKEVSRVQIIVSRFEKVPK